MWPVFELTYKLFKSEAVDFLEGTLVNLRFRPKVWTEYMISWARNAAFPRQLRFLWK